MTERKKCMHIYRGNVLPSTLNSLKFLSYWGSSTDSFSHWIASSSVQLCTKSKESCEKKNAYWKNRFVILYVFNTKLQRMGIQQRVHVWDYVNQNPIETFKSHDISDTALFLGHWLCSLYRWSDGLPLKLKMLCGSSQTMLENSGLNSRSDTILCELMQLKCSCH